MYFENDFNILYLYFLENDDQLSVLVFSISNFLLIIFFTVWNLLSHELFSAILWFYLLIYCCFFYLILLSQYFLNSSLL